MVALKLAQLEHAAERNHLACGIARLEQQRILRAITILLVGLRDHAEGAAKAVEVVDVERTQIRLQRLEHITEPDAELLDLHTVDVGVEQRCVDVVVAERVHELRIAAHLGEHFLRERVELLLAAIGLVLDLQLDATGRTEALDRRRRHHQHHRAVDHRQLLVQARRDRLPGDLAAAFFERSERQEHHGRIRRAREAVDRQARELHRVDHAGFFERNLADLLGDALGALDRGRRRQLHDAHQIALVLRRNEAGRRRLERTAREQHQARVDDQADHAEAQDAAHRVGVAVPGRIESAVERTEEPAERAVDDALQRIGPGVVIAQQQRGERRRQGQRVDRRNDRGERDGQRELAIEQAREAGHQCRRHEHRAEHQRDRDDRAAHFIHRTVCSRARRKPFGHSALDVLDHHDRIVDDDADREHQPEQGQRVEREAEELQGRERADDRHRNRDDRDQRRAPALQNSSTTSTTSSVASTSVSITFLIESLTNTVGS